MFVTNHTVSIITTFCFEGFTKPQLEALLTKHSLTLARYDDAAGGNHTFEAVGTPLAIARFLLDIEHEG